MNLTDTSTVDFDDVPRLPDPLDDPNHPLAVRSSTTQRQDLRRLIVGPPVRRTMRPAVLAAAAVAVIAVALGISFTGAATPADAFADAVADTVALERGAFTVDRTVTSGDRTLEQHIDVRFDDDAHEIVHRNTGAIIDPTPEELAIRHVDGVSYVQLATGWVVSPNEVSLPDGSPVALPTPLGPMGERIEAAAAAADDFSACDTSAPTVTSYCFSTDDTDLVEVLQPGVRTEYLSLQAEVRVDVDASTGLVAVIRIDATDIDVDSASLPGLEVPRIDRLVSEARFDALDSPTSILRPDLTPVEPDAPAETPWQCAGLEATLSIVDCLTHYGYDELSDHYAGLDLPPDPEVTQHIRTQP